jgi:predicted acyltransferase
VIIWLLGVILNLYGLVQLHVGPDLFRWPNVLNRIGFCYLVVGWMHVLVLWRGKQPEKPLSFSYLFAGDARPQTTSTVGDSKKDLLEEKQGVTEQDDNGPWPWFLRVTLPYYLPVACLVIWLICTYTVQVEGCPERAMIRDPECSPQAYFDLIIFGKAHTYRHLAFDPEGSLSTLTSILNVWFGWFIGCTVRSLNAQVKQLTKDFKTRRELRGDADDQASLVEQILEQEILVRLYAEHLGQWFWWGLLWMFTGWIFSFGLPLSKPSWTATYAVLAAGVSQTMLAILFFKFDVQPLSKRLRQLHLEHQGFRSNNQLSRHYRHRASDLEHPTGTSGRTNYSGALNVYFQVDHFLRHWFRKGIILVLGSMGRNAILMYMCSELVQGTCYLIQAGPADPVTGEKLDLFTTVYNRTWGNLNIGGWGSLFYGMGFAALHVLLAIFLDYKKWYFKV